MADMRSGWRRQRGYQYGFSENNPVMFDVPLRQQKARTMTAVLHDYLKGDASACRVLDIGASTGIIDDYLAGCFSRVYGMDIDFQAIQHARKTYRRENLAFQVGDALHLPFADNSMDVVICTHVYEHVPDARRMLEEIYRVLRPGGVCYFTGSNRFRLMEPHYHLPLLSAIPKPLAHVYMRLAGKGKSYYETHLSYWGLRSLVRGFELVDYTLRTVQEPEKFGTAYMVKPGSLKATLARLVLKYFRWASPGYIWLLKKPSSA